MPDDRASIRRTRFHLSAGTGKTASRQYFAIPKLGVKSFAVWSSEQSFNSYDKLKWLGIEEVLPQGYKRSDTLAAELKSINPNAISPTRKRYTIMIATGIMPEKR